MILELRTSAAPTAVAKQVRDLISEIDRNVLVETETLKSHVDGSLARERLLAMLSGFLGRSRYCWPRLGFMGVMA
jgi:hypothetical protein